MPQTNRRLPGSRSAPLRRSNAADPGVPRGRTVGPPPVGTVSAVRRRQPSSEELFGRRPFASGPELRYFGTGVAGYESGPGFTGGYYGYGDQPPEMPTELEREYAYEVYGEDAGPGWSSVRAFSPSGGYAPAVPPAAARHPQHVRRYPPGPKGYRRSDARMLEDICDKLLLAHHIDSSEVTVEVAAAKAILDGTVPERWMKHAIEDLADACPGIQDVENRIRVVKTSSAPSIDS